MVGLHISAASTPQVSLHPLSSLPIPRSQLTATETAMANHRLESAIEDIEGNSASDSDSESDSDGDFDELDDNPDCYPGTCLRRPLGGSALGGYSKKRKAANIDVGANEPKKTNLSRPAAPRSSPDAADAPDAPNAPDARIYSRETYTEEKDDMIRFLRDNLENTWSVVAQLYDEYWGSNVGRRKLMRRYMSTVPKDEQGRKRVGRSTTGDKEKGLKGEKKWDWMLSWEQKGKLK
jgi:hypothetical protein